MYSSIGRCDSRDRENMKISTDEAEHRTAAVPTIERVWVARSGVKDPHHLGVFGDLPPQSSLVLGRSSPRRLGHIIR